MVKSRKLCLQLPKHFVIILKQLKIFSGITKENYVKSYSYNAIQYFTATFFVKTLWEFFCQGTSPWFQCFGTFSANCFPTENNMSIYKTATLKPVAPYILRKQIYK